MEDRQGEHRKMSKYKREILVERIKWVERIGPSGRMYRFPKIVVSLLEDIISKEFKQQHIRNSNNNVHYSTHSHRYIRDEQ